MNLNELRAQRAMERRMEVGKEQFGNISHSFQFCNCNCAITIFTKRRFIHRGRREKRFLKGLDVTAYNGNPIQRATELQLKN